MRNCEAKDHRLCKLDATYFVRHKREEEWVKQWAK